MSRFSTRNVNIVIPNWNGVDLLRINLPKILSTAESADVIIVDDHSTDNSVNFIKKTYPAIRVIEKRNNEGFASTVNAGVEAANREIVVLLNTDIEPENGYLSKLVSHFNDSEVFAVGCADKSIEKDRVVLRGRGVAKWKNGFYLHARGETEGKKNTAWVSGGSGAFRRSMWKKLGGMDSLFNPFYWEDIDLSYRARKAGYLVHFEPASRVIHRHTQGSIKKNYSENKVISIAFRNECIFTWKNLTDRSILRDHIVNLFFYIIKSLVRFDIYVLRGFIAALLLLPAVLDKRRELKKIWKLKDNQLEVID